MPTNNTLLSAFVALAAVLALVLLCARVARWFGFAQPSGRHGGRHHQGRLAIQASLPLDRLRTLHIVRCDGQDLALLTGGTADLALGWLPQSSAPEDRP